MLWKSSLFFLLLADNYHLSWHGKPPLPHLFKGAPLNWVPSWEMRYSGIQEVKQKNRPWKWKILITKFTSFLCVIFRMVAHILRLGSKPKWRTLWAKEVLKIGNLFLFMLILVFFLWWNTKSSTFWHICECENLLFLKTFFAPNF